MPAGTNYVNIVSENPYSIQIQQRYNAKTDTANYKFISASFDTYRAFTVVAIYRCRWRGEEVRQYIPVYKDYERLYDESEGYDPNYISFYSGNDWRYHKYLRGDNGPCPILPYKTEIQISDEPFYGSTYDKKEKETQIGRFNGGVFREGIAQNDNGNTGFMKYDEKGNFKGEMIVHTAGGIVVIGNFVNNQLGGDFFEFKQSGGPKNNYYSHYSAGVKDTDQYFEKEARKRTKLVLNAEIKKKTATITKRIDRLASKIKDKESIVNSRKFKNERDNIVESGFDTSYRSCIPPLMLTTNPYNLSDAEKRRRAQVAKRAAQRKAAEKKVCEAMNDLRRDVDFTQLDSMDDLMMNADLSKLTDKKYSSLVEGIKAYREIQRRKPILIKETKKRRNLEEQIRQKQKARRKKVNAQELAKIKAEKMELLIEKKKWSVATRKCWDAYGFGPYNEWKAYPEAEPCNNDYEVRKYL